MFSHEVSTVIDGLYCCQIVYLCYWLSEYIVVYLVSNFIQITAAEGSELGVNICEVIHEICSKCSSDMQSLELVV